MILIKDMVINKNKAKQNLPISDVSSFKNKKAAMPNNSRFSWTISNVKQSCCGLSNHNLFSLQLTGLGIRGEQ